MSRGGARNRSGPAPDPNSKRSESRGIGTGMRALPAAGHTGKPPPWPMPKGTPRERSLWTKIWKFPQAVAWAEEPWRHLQIGHYVRWAVKSESADASPSTMTQVIRLADSIGLTPAGLRENGWVIQKKTVEEAAESATETPPAVTARRLRPVSDAS